MVPEMLNYGFINIEITESGRQLITTCCVRSVVMLVVGQRAKEVQLYLFSRGGQSRAWGEKF